MNFNIEPFKAGQEYDINMLIMRVYDEFVATVDSQIVGMVETRDDKYISLLFVDKLYHRMGIAKALFKTALENCLCRDSTFKKFYVHASPYSINVYVRLGFKDTGGMRVENGIKYLPMEMEL